jgi:threonine dehydratase
MIPYEWIDQAYKRIQPYIWNTSVTYDEVNQIYLKWDNKQITGSFKVRGALNKILDLQPWERNNGLVTASAGNHGQGVAFAANIKAAKATIFCSDHAVPSKISAMKALGAKVILVHGGYAEAEQAGIEYAQQKGSVWISPYNDGKVISGQATLALETTLDQPNLADFPWLVPVGGGGLIAGLAQVLKKQSLRNRTIGVQSTASPFFYELYKHNTQDGIVELPSLADGLAGPVEEGSITIPIVHKLIDDFFLVSESEIEEAIAYAYYQYDEVIEGSAATVLAASLFGKIKERPVVLVISGGNIQPEVHAEIINKYPREKNVI